MARKPSQTHRKRPLVRQATALEGIDSLSLVLGPSPRLHADWAERERLLLADWNAVRAVLMDPDTYYADPALGLRPKARPWAYFWFDRPHADTIPGPRRDALLKEGRLSEHEAENMARWHSTFALWRIATSRPGQTLGDWLADPALIESAVALVGWNPFDERVMAYLRQSQASIPP